jgi:trk system potassium uptake protein TrkA
MSLGDMMTLLKLRRGEFSRWRRSCPWIAVLRPPDLALPATRVSPAVIRAGQVLIPRGNMVFEVGDEVLAVVDTRSLPVLKELFGPAS